MHILVCVKPFYFNYILYFRFSLHNSTGEARPHLPALTARPCLSRKRKVFIRGGVEDTRLKAKAKDTKKIRGQGQGQPFRGQTLSRPRTGVLEAKAKDQGHSRKCSPKKRSSKKFFRQSPI